MCQFHEEKEIGKILNVKSMHVQYLRKLKVDGRVKAEFVSGRYNMK